MIRRYLDRPASSKRSPRGSTPENSSSAISSRSCADVACGFRRSPRAAFLKRQFDRIASLSAFYRKLGRMEPAVPAAIVRQTAESGSRTDRGRRGAPARADPGVFRPDPRRQRPGRDRPSDRRVALDPLGGPARQVAGHLRADQWPGPRPHPGGERPYPGAGVAGSGGRRAGPTLDHGSQLLRPDRSCSASSARTPSSWSAGTPRTCRSSRSSRSDRSPVVTPARSSSNRSGSTIRNARADVTACGGSSCGWINPTREGETEIVLITNLPDEIAASLGCEVYRGRWQIETDQADSTSSDRWCEATGAGYDRRRRAA